MEQQKKIEERAKVHGYEDYLGPHGPSAEQTLINTQALQKVLEEDGFQVAQSTLGEQYPGVFDEASNNEVLILVGKKEISYDRWGFVSDEAGELDQASIDDAYKYMTS